MNSLERSLHLALGAALVVLFGTLWLLGQQAIRELTEDYVVSRLEHDAETILAALALDRGKPRVRRNRVSDIYHQPYSGHYYLVLLESGSEIPSRSLWDQRLAATMLEPGQRRRSVAAGPNDQQLLLLEQGFDKQGQRLTLAVAEDMTPLRTHREAFERYFGLFALGSLLGLLAVQGLIVRRMLRRLVPVRRQIKELAQGTRSRLSEDVPQEIRPLVSELNHLARLTGQRLERSRNALGNLAHALKGPLNIITHYLDQQHDGADAAMQRQARKQAQHIRQLMERELKRARLAGSGIAGRQFEPQTELPGLAEVLRQIYRTKALDIRIEVAPGIAPFADREDMLELIGNLLDNACKWAVGKARCRVTEEAEIRIRIDNDGPQLDQAQLAGLTERGTRLDESVEGHGLGLAIAKEIVEIYRGRILFSTSAELGGLQVEVRLPRHQDTQE